MQPRALLLSAINKTVIDQLEALAKGPYRNQSTFKTRLFGECFPYSLKHLYESLNLTYLFSETVPEKFTLTAFITLCAYGRFLKNAKPQKSIKFIEKQLAEILKTSSSPNTLALKDLFSLFDDKRNALLEDLINKVHENIVRFVQSDNIKPDDMISFHAQINQAITAQEFKETFLVKSRAEKLASADLCTLAHLEDTILQTALLGENLIQQSSIRLTT